MSKTYEYIVDVIAKTKQFTDGMQQIIQQTGAAEKQVDMLNQASEIAGGILKEIAIGVGAAFSVEQVIDFGKEIVGLSGEVAGVKRAFKLIGNEDYLESLRQSTHNTVSDLELMKLAVQANNFQIPLQQLGDLFEFAAARAQSTGESVNYLVDSIVEGIGKKQPKILDNLGISSIALKEKLHGISMEEASVADMAKAMGEIASDNLRKTGGYAETTATKIAQVSTQWKNYKEELSQSESVISTVSSVTSMLSNALTQFDGMVKGMKAPVENMKWWENFFYQIKGAQTILGMFSGSYDAVNEKLKKSARSVEMAKKAAEVKKEDAAGAAYLIANLVKAGEAAKGLSSEVTKWAEENKKAAKEIKTPYEQLDEKIKDLTLHQQNLALAGKDISGIAAQIKAINKQKEAIDKLVESQNKAANYNIGGAIASGSGNPGTALLKTENKKLGLDIDPASIKKVVTPYQNALNQLEAADEAFKEKHMTMVNAIEGGFDQIGESVVDGLGFAEKGLGGFVKTMMETATKLIAMALSESLANAILGATESGTSTGPAAVFTTPAFIATAIGGILSAFAAIPKFATGALAFGPTLGVFGEYAGASSNPEVVAPLNRLKDMIQPSGSTVIMPAGVEIDGYKLRVLLKKVDKNINSRV